MIALSMGAKVKKPEDLWGLWSDKISGGRDQIIMTKEMLEKIKKAHNIK